MKLAIQSLLLLSAVTLLVTGCSSSEYDQNAYDFDPERSRTRAILNAQYAKGAADDGSLSVHHFTDQRLNGLGRDKLDRMMAAGRRDGELVVHVDVPAAIETEPLLEAVRGYLAASGVTVTAETVVLGPSDQRSDAGRALAGVHQLNKKDGGAGKVGSASNDVMASQNAGLFGGQ